MIRNIVLDIGDVLVDSSWYSFFSNKGFSYEMVKRIADATFFSPAWRELDRGVRSFDEMMEEFIKNDPEIEQELRLAFINTNKFVEMFSYSIPWIKELKSYGYKVYCLSNISDKIHHDSIEEFEFLKYLDGSVLSYIEKMVKPEEKIYKLLLERYSLNPIETVFIDNTPENIVPAKKLGMYGIIFTNIEQAKNELKTLRKG